MTDEQTIEGAVEIETGITPREDGTLEVFYRVSNELNSTILLLTPLSALEENVVRAAPERVYAYVDPNGALHVTKRLWPVPDALDVFFPDVPFATEVRSGETFEERLRLRLPIEIDYPYRATGGVDMGKDNGVVATARGFAFSIGYLVENEGPLRKGPLSEEAPEILVVGYGAAVRNQRILQGELLNVGIPVRDSKA